jgi:4a-hydroxytetrahydrobiopterin dehydratase
MDTTDDEALLRVVHDLPGWERHGNSIQKTYHFDDFGSATRFVGRVADAAVAAGRQPDIAIHRSRVTLELNPSPGGTLTTDDAAVARRIQRLVGDHRHPVGRAGPWSPGGRLAGIRPRPVGPAGP